MRDSARHGTADTVGTKTQQKLQVMVRKRDGRLVDFDGSRIETAILKAFKAQKGLGEGQDLHEDLRFEISRISSKVVERFLDVALSGVPLEIENIQDAVETQLMQHGHYTVARRYIVYREERKRARLIKDGLAADCPAEIPPAALPEAQPKAAPLDTAQLEERIRNACRGFEDTCSPDLILAEVMQSSYTGITEAELDQALVLAARTHIERSPDYSFVAARLLLDRLYAEAWGEKVDPALHNLTYRQQFEICVQRGVSAGLLDEALLSFNLQELAQALKTERDQNFRYAGLQALYDRYLLQVDGVRVETPQYFFMRIAMGLALNEGEDKTRRAIEFYELLSSFRFMTSTPILFNAGTRHPQLSSSYLSTIQDDLDHIFKGIADNARLSKWAGGMGNDWSNVRAAGSHINGTNSKSQGVIPFLKVANDTALAVNQVGKRRGAMCAYLETWHLDIEDFLELRKTSGDARRRTHDMNTANWIPDLFMKRARDNGTWTLFSPSDTPDLHHLYGKLFEERYLAYEAMAERGEIKLFKKVEALPLWRKMLTMLIETGHPRIAFKDPANIRSPQDHAGLIHSSNLCTEIFLNTSEDETAACSLGSINLPAHTTRDGLDENLLSETVTTAVRMLDNAIDISFYPTPEAQKANLQHRPFGLGLMGFQDALHIQEMSYASDEAVQFADQSTEMVSYYAILASTDLAFERGSYPSFEDSKWARGMLPIDTIGLLAEERGEPVSMDRTGTMNWEAVRLAVQANGMRNSNTMAIAPTSAISTLCGVSPSIEPSRKNLFTTSHPSGDFTTINPYLFRDLKERGLWNEQMLDDLKYFEGSLQDISTIPDDLKTKYLTIFDIEPGRLIECASRRQKWIDMGQSLNLYITQPDGKKLHEMYMLAWEKGLKAIYCLGTKG